ncbi:MAG: hypothetical protein GX136_00750 [Clostridiales bacterium]|jgi:hypothetical protein|nr:hypothetical protein [Clostridiales bacterium]
MEKKHFWKRTNRGFVVSMALLAIVLVYVIVGQLMLIPDHSAIQKLTDKYREMIEETSMLTESQITALKKSGALEAEGKRLKNELSEYFVKDSAYIDEAVSILLKNIQQQTNGYERITKRSKGRRTDKSNIIDQNIAKTEVTYLYKSSGEYMDYSTEKMEQANDVKQELYIEMSCKKDGGEWKIYRVSMAMLDSLSSTQNDDSSSVDIRIG